jgi:hypothetical protein
MRDSRERCVMCKIDKGGLVVRDRGEREEGCFYCARETKGCVCIVREACDFEKWFRKNFGVNHFSKFCTTFSGQQKSFAIDQTFIMKQTPTNIKNILQQNKRNWKKRNSS